MSSSPFNNKVGSQAGTWEQTPLHAPTPGYFDRERTPSVYCPSPNRTYGERSTPLPQPEPSQLGFLDEAECNRGTYNEDSLTSINYLIE